MGAPPVTVGSGEAAPGPLFSAGGRLRSLRVRGEQVGPAASFISTAEELKMAEFLDNQDTQLCDNCKKEIPVFNFTIHEIHCQRNIGVCPLCKEPFPKSDMETHMATEHCQVTCKCNRKLEKRQLKNHEETECPLRLAVCQHCDLELSVMKLKDHEDYCGARTELCGSCGRNVLVKDLKIHPEVCGKGTEEKRAEVAAPPSAYDESRGRDGIWIASQLLRQIEALDPPTRLSQRPTRSFESDLFPSRTTSHRNITTRFPIQNNLLEEQERQERNRSRQSTKVRGEDNANLDFMLALSLQNEGQAPIVAEPDFWSAMYDTEETCEAPTSINDKKGAADETMLPCEFCEELYPEKLLIDHQTICNPSRALPSRSVGSPSPRGVEDPDVIFQKFLQKTANNQFDSLMGLSNSLPQEEDSIIIPCEFCGVQLEQEVLFHHQDQCDQRPATASSLLMEGIPRHDSQPRATSPEQPKRRIRHQGELYSSYMDDIKQETAKGPSCPLSPSRTINNMSATFNRLSSSTSTAGCRPECQSSAAHGLKLNNSQDLQGRKCSSQNGATAHVPVIQSTRSLYPENLVPSLPHGATGRYGARSEGGRNSRVTPVTTNYHNRAAKQAKPSQQQGAGHVEEEEEE